MTFVPRQPTLCATNTAGSIVSSAAAVRAATRSSATYRPRRA
ncbi:hypothetical protein ACH4OY_18410 [Micromonospora rubida]|uniref:Uncharacterized protein n=1 Tax=Micromonospora rubida TaxID=2697657 RepID=A0ABW7SNZ9_9ACTN